MGKPGLRATVPCAGATPRTFLFPQRDLQVSRTTWFLERQMIPPSQEVPHGERAVRSQATATAGNILPGSQTSQRQKGLRNSWARATLKTQVRQGTEVRPSPSITTRVPQSGGLALENHSHTFIEYSDTHKEPSPALGMGVTTELRRVQWGTEGSLNTMTSFPC